MRSLAADTFGVDRMIVIVTGRTVQGMNGKNEGVFQDRDAGYAETAYSFGLRRTAAWDTFVFVLCLGSNLILPSGSR